MQYIEIGFRLNFKCVSEPSEFTGSLKEGKFQ